MGVYYFGAFQLDEAARRLSCLGEPVPLTVMPTILASLRARLTQELQNFRVALATALQVACASPLARVLRHHYALSKLLSTSFQ
jgi:hypothetical protein